MREEKGKKERKNTQVRKKMKGNKKEKGRGGEGKGPDLAQGEEPGWCAPQFC